MPQKSRQTASSRYIVQLPIHDHHHNALRDLSTIGWQWLEQQIPNLIHSIHTEGPHPGHRGSSRHLNVFAYDTPETDSTIKQLASYVGELCNRATILVTKEGPSGAQAWRIANRKYVPGGAAHPHIIEFQARPTSIS